LDHLVAVKIVDLARRGEFDVGRLTTLTLADVPVAITIGAIQKTLQKSDPRSPGNSELLIRPSPHTEIF
jgi:hypothetical protein